MLCGKSCCPLIVKAEKLLGQLRSIDSEKIQGSTPPSVFVGRIGYPKVYVGPLIPPFHGDTAFLDTPETWIGRGLEDIVNFRSTLVRGKFPVSADQPLRGGSLFEKLQEMALAARPVDAEALFAQKPQGAIVLSDEVQPFGPSAPLRAFWLSNVHADRVVEKCYYDDDLKAGEAVLQLYRDGVPVSKIQRCFSLGMFGDKGRRRVVPTRWSITAVDEAISLSLLREVRRYPPVGEYRVYAFKNLDNIFTAIFLPEAWSFEWIEAWFPGTVWNPQGREPELMGDYEGFRGRTTYADVGGCYYAARLAAAEALSRERRQAKVLILREIRNGYLLPVGVWNVRESVRQALKTQPHKFASFLEALDFAMRNLSVPLKAWLPRSVILRQALFQRKLADFSPQG
jgi:hypothetical protein